MHSVHHSIVHYSTSARVVRSSYDSGLMTHAKWNCELQSSLSRDTSGTADTFRASQQRVFRSPTWSPRHLLCRTLFLIFQFICVVVYELPTCILGAITKSARIHGVLVINCLFQFVDAFQCWPVIRWVFFLLYFIILFWAWTFLHARFNRTQLFSLTFFHTLAIHHVVSNKVATFTLINETLAVMQNVPSPSAFHLGSRVCVFARIVFVFISLSHFIILLFLHWTELTFSVHCAPCYNMYAIWIFIVKWWGIFLLKCWR